ncbi:PREDICTED: endogenous retrovirus group K member 19 Pol protein-like [Nicotiana attenuata]|uniref:endogenous retrovirus group K member 19 Pol protein-like n=1 Tax=Nicotiana attenuata TaxID=49451 RepID=UPI000904CC42|nr:PREDICTED: endogenous retrovirus group K member 19 Pol protein-like [Nicotiana attenuata]XP_019241473.1 PREDICTED: endogenous retrovirus group K member 19 Pol protein-like [Nicotiana attenuata]XP_019262363.1 PREDICTED: endogenous retrovirus group K member 19 Pol protein-like [Nicotiana attenuata]
MLVKSKRKEDHIDHLQEAFDILRQYDMKLNPEKCAFGVTSGKFLDFLVSQRGIEVNPDKIKAIEGIPEMLTSKKQVQKLTGRIAALSRFISRSSDRCHKLFNVLKEDNGLQWNSEYVNALRKLKAYLSSPPLLAKADPGECLLVYLAVFEVAVSAVLVRENKGYYWPTMKKEAMDYVKKCEQCQKYGSMIHQGGELLHSVTSPCPFIKWGMDIAEPRPAGRGSHRIHMENIICRFSIPNEISCENGPQFVGKKMIDFFEKWRIKRILSTPYHPGGNGQAESSNKIILNILKKKLEDAKGLWSELLPEVLWAYRTMPKTSTCETPYSLVYGTDAVIPVEVGEPSLRYSNESGPNNNENRIQDLDEVEERRDMDHLRMVAQKQQAES